MADKPDLPSHVESTIENLTALHAHHHEGASRRVLAISFLTGVMARPEALFVVCAVAAGWAAFAWSAGHGDIHNAAFAWLELSATFAALFVAIMILVAQRHEDALVNRRAELTLELALVADQKVSKMISLVEELRKDAPGISDRHDQQSEDMAQPSDPDAVLNELDRRA